MALSDEEKREMLEQFCVIDNSVTWLLDLISKELDATPEEEPLSSEQRDKIIKLLNRLQFESEVLNNFYKKYGEYLK